MILSDGQRLALQNLAEKHLGHAVEFINIADARALTNMGLATRSRQGWRITAHGAALIEAPGAETTKS